MKKLTTILAKISNALTAVYKMGNELDIQKMLTAKLLLHEHRHRTEEFINDLQLAEFQVFSQWGDDGIIQFLINYIDIEYQSFIEFGVENYRESTTRFLLMNNNWQGFVMDASAKNMRSLKAQDIYWRYDLKAIATTVGAENINGLIEASGFAHNTGLLHIDIDGNDYWVWKAVKNIEPAIVIVEYNHWFGSQLPYVMPYNVSPGHGAARGASLQSLCDLAEEKGYVFVGCESHGVNAYFVRKDKCKNLRALTAKEGYVRSKAGAVKSLAGVQQTFELWNTRTAKLETVSLNQLHDASIHA